jgi:ABC-type transport system involved in cytochrome c biogenesis permease subunit
MKQSEWSTFIKILQIALLSVVIGAAITFGWPWFKYQSENQSATKRSYGLPPLLVAWNSQYMDDVRAKARVAGIAVAIFVFLLGYLWLKRKPSDAEPHDLSRSDRGACT